MKNRPTGYKNIFQTGGLWWQVQLHWNVWSYGGMCGPSRQVIFHGNTCFTVSVRRKNAIIELGRLKFEVTYGCGGIRCSFNYETKHCFLFYKVADERITTPSYVVVSLSFLVQDQYHPRMMVMVLGNSFRTIQIKADFMPRWAPSTQLRVSASVAEELCKGSMVANQVEYTFISTGTTYFFKANVPPHMTHNTENTAHSWRTTPNTHKTLPHTTHNAQ